MTRKVKMSDSFLVALASNQSVQKAFPQVKVYYRNLTKLKPTCCRAQTRLEVMALNGLRDYIGNIPEDQRNKLKTLLNLPSNVELTTR